VADTLFDRLAKHAVIFSAVAKKNLASHYEEVQQRGREAEELAADLMLAMEVVRQSDNVK
jgi:hypothetical protein